MTKTRFALACLATAVTVLMPSLASAQSTISGVVKDASGAVIPGASVTAASDALIERQRTVTTNGEGRYAIVDLRPGTYVVTVTQQGFDTVKQTIELPSDVTFPVDASLKVGSVGETVVVESRVATVDTENAAHPTTLTRSEMDELPTGRYMQSIASYVPGAHLNLPDVGGSQQIEQNYISVHGSGSGHDTYLLDGMLVNTNYADGQIQQYIDNAAIQETTSQASNVGVEVSGGGMYTSLIPKDGGNQFHFNLFAGGSASSNFWEANNINQTLIDRGLGGQTRVVKVEDYDASLGGPVIKDKLWFMMTGREQVTYTQAGASQYPNGAPGIEKGHIFAGSMRLTYQMNQKNKFSAFFMRNWKYKNPEIAGQLYTPSDPSTSATQRAKWPMYFILQTKWTSTPTPKLITEVGMSISHLDYNDIMQTGQLQGEGSPLFDALTSQQDQGTLRRYISGVSSNYYQTNRNVFQTNETYVTGSHQIKFGAIYSFGPNHFAELLNGDGYENFTNGVPTSFTAYNTPFYQRAYLKGDAGIYGTDTWHFKRLAVTAGLRWEYLAAEIQEENSPQGRFAPARTVPQIDCSTIKGMGCWKDWTPRIGGVYDVFGNHKTALKAGFGKYNAQYGTGFTSTFNPMAVQTETLTWNAAALGANCNPIPTKVGSVTILQPNPLCFASGGFAPQGTAAANIPAGGLGPSPGATFGSVGSSTGIANDPNYHRDYSYQYNAGVQQELYKGITLNANWFRRSSYQSELLVNENSLPTGSWTPSTIVNPLDGTPITVFNLSPTITSLPTASLYQTNAPQSLVRNVYSGYETQVVARLGHGLFTTFGWTLDRQLDRACAENVTTGKNIADPNSLRYCDTFGDPSLTVGGINVESLGKVSPPWANAFTAQGSIPIKYGIVGSVSFLSNNYQGNFAGGSIQPNGVNGTGTLNNGYLARTIAITSAKTSVYPQGSVGVAPALASGTACTANGGYVVGCPIDPGYNALQGGETINLVSPGQVRTPRLNQLDLSFKRTFKFREKYTLEPTIQLFNILNSSAAVVQSTALSTASTGNFAGFLPASACASSTVGSLPNCGLGGSVTTITNPRILKVVILFKF